MVVLECARTLPMNTKIRCIHTKPIAKLAARSGSRYELKHHAERRHAMEKGSLAASGHYKRHSVQDTSEQHAHAYFAWMSNLSVSISVTCAQRT